MEHQPALALPGQLHGGLGEDEFRLSALPVPEIAELPEPAVLHGEAAARALDAQRAPAGEQVLVREVPEQGLGHAKLLQPGGDGRGLRAALRLGFPGRVRAGEEERPGKQGRRAQGQQQAEEFCVPEPRRGGPERISGLVQPVRQPREGDEDADEQREHYDGGVNSAQSR